MFDFLFKKRPAQVVVAPDARPTVAEQAIDAKNQVRQAALARARNFSGEEAAALTFLLASEFADARLQALQSIDSEAALIQVAQAMRNADKRVYRQAQEKLATLKNLSHRHQMIQVCRQRGEALLAQQVLLVNQLADWDRQVTGLGEPDAELPAMRAALDVKMQQQLVLQRQVIQLADDTHALSGLGLPSDVLQGRLLLLRQAWLDIQADTVFASIPKHQLNRVAQELTALQTLADQPTVVVAVLAPTALRVDAPIEAVIEAVIDEPIEEPIEVPAVIRQAKQQDASLELAAILTALAQALEQGSLQQALDMDKTLRKRALPERGEQAAQLQTLRAELTRLLDWARWGGHISRTELIGVADQLLQSNQAPADIGRQVGGLRARWKELDRTSGPADKPLWAQFDQACSRAYQIAEQHFKQQAQLRQLNLGAAQAVLSDLDAMLVTGTEPLVDLFALQTALSQKKTAWRNIGVIDRKQKTALQLVFDEKWALLHEPLDAAREQAVAQRRALIAAVIAIDPEHRQAIDQIKAAQQRWQQESLAMRLEARLEQALWQQFRSACDDLFAARKLHSDQTRQTQQQAAQDAQHYCDQLQLALEHGAPQIATMLRQARQRRSEMTGHSRTLDSRFHALIAQLELRHAALLGQEKYAGLTNLRAKIALCRQLEAAQQLTANASQMAAWEQQWQLLLAGPELAVSLGQQLTQRFRAGLLKLSQGQSGQDQVLPTAQQQFAQSLLQLELLRNLPSPADLAPQRLQLQISHLQLAMKQRDGVGADHYLKNLQAICRMVIPLDAVLEQRFQAILEDTPNVTGLV